jgi:hypothetical protein
MENRSLFGRTLPVAAAFAVLLSSGLVHGLWTDRWGVSDEPAASAARLESVAKTVGDWEASDLEIDAQSLARGGIAGYLMRSYTHRRTGSEVSVFIACGRPGHVAVHTPDICYQGAGYRLQGGQQKRGLSFGSDSTPAEFWTATFAKDESAMPSRLRIFWAWCATGSWEAAEHPRLSYARFSSLYKLYVTCRIPVANEAAANDICGEFLGQFLPELRRSLFPDR